MHPFALRTALAVVLAILAVLVVAIFAGAIRAMPWLADPAVPLQVVWPFARELARVAIEVAVVLGIPIGVSAATAGFVHRGEARALLSLGQSPARLALAACSPVLACVVFASIVAVMPRPDAGRFAGELLGRGRQACNVDAAEPRAVQVPVVGVNWLCFPGQVPRVAGVPPGLGPAARFSAADLRPGDDLERLELDDVRVVVPSAEVDRPGLTLRVGRAVVRGLVPWAAPRGAAGVTRALAVAVSELLLAGLLACLLVTRAELSRALAVLGGGVAGGALLGALRTIDRRAEGPWAYVALPVFGSLLALAVAAALARPHRAGAAVARSGAR